MPIRKGGQRYSGAAFNGNEIMATRPYSHIPNRQVTKFVKLSRFGEANGIKMNRRRYMIKKKMLCAVRRGGDWWCCVNPYMLDYVLEYLKLDSVADLWDADNSYDIEPGYIQFADTSVRPNILPDQRIF